MNKLMLTMIFAAVLVVSLGTIETVYAQAPIPQSPIPGATYEQGSGSHVDSADMIGAMGIHPDGTQTGLLHDEMITAFAEKTGFSVDDLNNRLNNGETLGEIALAKGLTGDEFSALMSGVRYEAVAQALANGEITQQQAEWMQQNGPGGGGGGGRRGPGGGGRHGPGDGTGTGVPTYPNCPNYPPAVP